MTDICIVIVTYNSMDFIEDCLESIFEQTYKEFGIIVVDNNSRDKTVDFIKNKYPQVSLIENRQNRGFPYACNQGINAAKSKYILTLNSDVVLDVNFLNEIIKPIGSVSSNVGMISPKILWARDKDIIDSTGLVLSWLRRFFSRGREELDKSQYDSRKEIFGPCAASALYKRDMLEDIKAGGEYFDEDFFLLLEDFDLAWRANRFGWKALYAPEAVCYHVRNISGLKNKYTQYLCFRNRYFLILKNETWLGFIKMVIVFFVYDLWRNLYMLATNTKYFLKASYEIMKFFPKMMRKRHK